MGVAPQKMKRKRKGKEAERKERERKQRKGRKDLKKAGAQGTVAGVHCQAGGNSHQLSLLRNLGCEGARTWELAWCRGRVGPRGIIHP